MNTIPKIPNFEDTTEITEITEINWRYRTQPISQTSCNKDIVENEEKNISSKIYDVIYASPKPLSSLQILARTRISSSNYRAFQEAMMTLLDNDFIATIEGENCAQFVIAQIKQEVKEEAQNNFEDQKRWIPALAQKSRGWLPKRWK